MLDKCNFVTAALVIDALIRQIISYFSIFVPMRTHLWLATLKFCLISSLILVLLKLSVGLFFSFHCLFFLCSNRKSLHSVFGISNTNNITIVKTQIEIFSVRTVSEVYKTIRHYMHWYSISNAITAFILYLVHDKNWHLL